MPRAFTKFYIRTFSLPVDGLLYQGVDRDGHTLFVTTVTRPGITGVEIDQRSEGNLYRAGRIAYVRVMGAGLTGSTPLRRIADTADVIVDWDRWRFDLHSGPLAVPGRARDAAPPPVRLPRGPDLRGLGGPAALGYVEPRSQVFTLPDEFGTFLLEIDRSVQSLAHDIANHAASFGGDAGASFLRNWEQFKADWYHYYNAFGRGVGVAVGSTSAANEWARRYNAFESQYQQLTGLDPTLPNPEGGGGGLPWWAWGAIGVAGLFAVGWVASSVAKFVPQRVVVEPAR